MEQGERAQAALRAAGLLSEPMSEMRRRAKEYDAQHTPTRQAEILSELRGLRLEPSLSDIIVKCRGGRPIVEGTGKE